MTMMTADARVLKRRSNIVFMNTGESPVAGTGLPECALQRRRAPGVVSHAPGETRRSAPGAAAAGSTPGCPAVSNAAATDVATATVPALRNRTPSATTSRNHASSGREKIRQQASPVPVSAPLVAKEKMPITGGHAPAQRAQQDRETNLEAVTRREAKHQYFLACKLRRIASAKHSSLASSLYWFNRAALNGHPAAIKKMRMFNERLPYSFSRKKTDLFSNDTGPVLGAPGLGMLAAPLFELLRVVNGLWLLPETILPKWAVSRAKEQREGMGEIKRQAQADHERALGDLAVKAENLCVSYENRSGKEILSAAVFCGSSLDPLAGKQMISYLYNKNNPELWPVLDAAAALVTRGMKICLLDTAWPDLPCAGFYCQQKNMIFVHYNNEVSYENVAGVLVHEFTHAVADRMYENKIKTYQTKSQKKKLVDALAQSEAREYRDISCLSIDIAVHINKPFTHYKEKNSYKVERLVRVPQHLSIEGNREVLEKDYSGEWKCFLDFSKDCEGFIKKKQQDGWKFRQTPESAASEPAAHNADASGVTRPGDSAGCSGRSLALGIVARVIRQSGSSMRDKRLQKDIFDEVKLLRKVILDKSEPLNSIPQSQRRLQYERLVEELSAFYLRHPALHKTGPGGEKQYDFNCIGLGALEKEVERVIAVICASASPASGHEPAGLLNGVSEATLLEVRGKSAAPGRTANTRAKAYRSGSVH
jgi:hypothetical protein